MLTHLACCTTQRQLCRSRSTAALGTVTACYYLAERLRQHLGHGEEADEEAVHKKCDQRGVVDPVTATDSAATQPESDT